MPRLIVLLLVVGVLAIPSHRGNAAHSSPAQLHAASLPIALGFEPNRGQADGTIRFLWRGTTSTVALTPAAMVVSLARVLPKSRDRRMTTAGGFARLATIRFSWQGANPHPLIVGVHPLPGHISYFVGNDPRRWHPDIPTYAAVEYRNLYPGISLLVSDRSGRLVYDWDLARGADPSRIRVAVSGAGRLTLDHAGDLHLGGWGIQERPVVQGTAAEYVLRGARTVGVRVGPGMRNRPFIIDPVVKFATYLGEFTDSHAVTVNAAGDIYIAGQTYAADFPSPASVKGASGQDGDGFVAELNPDGNAVLWGAYVGGQGFDDTHGVAVDAAGNVLVSGETDSTDFPTVNAVDATFGGGTCYTTLNPNAFYGIKIEPVPCYDAFAAKLSPTGDRLIYSTYLGGNDEDIAYAVAADAAGDAVVAGGTYSLQFPLKGAVQSHHGGDGTECERVVDTGGATQPGYCSDAFVTTLGPTGALLWSTFLGGGDEDWATAVAVTAQGAIDVAGLTYSVDFPTHNAFQPLLTDTVGAAFLSQLSADGSQLTFSTYFGGTAPTSPPVPTDNPNATVEATDTAVPTDVPTSTGPEVTPTPEPSTPFGGTSAAGIALDSQGNIYLTGTTDSPSLPTLNAVQGSLKSENVEAYVAEFNPTASSLVYSTYLGGSGGDEADGIAVDAGDNAYVVGTTESADFPTVNSLEPPPQPTENCADPLSDLPTGICTKIFVSRLGLRDSSLVYSTYMGGSDLNQGEGIALDGRGDAFVVGSSFGTDFPSATVFPGQAIGTDPDAPVSSGVLVKLYDTPSATLTPTPTDTPTPTATPKPKPVKPATKCKKGYRVVHGKCKKKKR